MSKTLATRPCSSLRSSIPVGLFLDRRLNRDDQTMSFAGVVEDISLSQWLALTPPELVKAHLGFDDATIASLNKTKQVVIGPK